MKKTAIIASILTITAVTTTLWQMHGYNQDVRATLEAENLGLRQAVAHSERLVSQHEQAIVALETRLKGLTNQPAGDAKARNS